MEEKRPWIERTLRRLRESEAELPPARLEDGGEVPYLGERLRPAAGSRGPARRVTAPCRRPRRRRCRSSARRPCATALERWYRRRARDEVVARLDAAMARAGAELPLAPDPRPAHPLGHVLVQAAAMSFNWRLLLAPAEILDYVVEHEVAHLEVQDHSERFWALLGERCPDWREHERWLRRHGHALRL